MYLPETHADLLATKARRVFEKHRPECLFSNFDEAVRSQMQAILPLDAGDPLVVFFDNSSLWTVLTSTHLLSRVGNDSLVLSLQEVRDNYVVGGKDADNAHKNEMNWVLFPGASRSVWAPSAEHLSLLLNAMQIVFHRNN